jgi:hypothetical protein
LRYQNKKRLYVIIPLNNHSYEKEIIKYGIACSSIRYAKYWLRLITKTWGTAKAAGRTGKVAHLR